MKNPLLSINVKSMEKIVMHNKVNVTLRKQETSFSWGCVNRGHMKLATDSPPGTLWTSTLAG